MSTINDADLVTYQANTDQKECRRRKWERGSRKLTWKKLKHVMDNFKC